MITNSVLELILSAVVMVGLGIGLGFLIIPATNTKKNKAEAKKLDQLDIHLKAKEKVLGTYKAHEKAAKNIKGLLGSFKGCFEEEKLWISSQAYTAERTREIAEESIEAIKLEIQALKDK